MANNYSTQLAELYTAFFNRAPDASGFAFWLSHLEAGDITLAQMATDWATNQAETALKYPSGMSTEQFVEAIYNNVLGRDSDEFGKLFWVQALSDESIQRENFIQSVIEAAHTNGSQDGNFLTNRATVGELFASNGINDGTLAEKILSTVTAQSDSVKVASAIIEIIPKNTELSISLIQSLSSIIDNIGTISETTPSSLDNLTLYIVTVATQLSSHPLADIDAIVNAIETVTHLTAATPDVLSNPTQIATNTLENPSVVFPETTTPTVVTPPIIQDSVIPNEPIIPLEPIINATPSTTITIDYMQRTISFYPSDGGLYANDFITNIKSQNLFATLSQALRSDEKLLYSLDSGCTWVDGTNNVVDKSFSGVISLLDGTNSIQMKVVNTLSNNMGTSASKEYTLDQTEPTWSSHITPEGHLRIESSEAGITMFCNVTTKEPFGQFEFINDVDRNATLNMFVQDSVTDALLAVHDVAGNTGYAPFVLGTMGDDILVDTSRETTLYGCGGKDLFVIGRYDMTNDIISPTVVADYKPFEDRLQMSTHTAQAWATLALPTGWSISNKGIVSKENATLTDFYFDFRNAKGNVGDIATFISGTNAYVFAEGDTDADTDNSLACVKNIETKEVLFSDNTVSIIANPDFFAQIDSESKTLFFVNTHNTDYSITMDITGTMATFTPHSNVNGVIFNVTSASEELSAFSSIFLGTDTLTTSINGVDNIVFKGTGNLTLQNVESLPTADLSIISEISGFFRAEINLSNSDTLEFTGNLSNAIVDVKPGDDNGGTLDITKSSAILTSKTSFNVSEKTSLVANANQIAHVNIQGDGDVHVFDSDGKQTLLFSSTGTSTFESKGGNEIHLTDKSGLDIIKYQASDLKASHYANADLVIDFERGVDKISIESFSSLAGYKKAVAENGETLISSSDGSIAAHFIVDPMAVEDIATDEAMFVYYSDSGVLTFDADGLYGTTGSVIYVGQYISTTGLNALMSQGDIILV